MGSFFRYRKMNSALDACLNIQVTQQLSNYEKVQS